MATTKHKFILEAKYWLQHIKAINYLARSIMATTSACLVIMLAVTELSILVLKLAIVFIR